MAGPGRGRKRSCDWAWLRRRRSAGVSGSLDPCPAAPRLRLGRVLLLTEAFLPWVWGCAGSVAWGCGGTEAC